MPNCAAAVRGSSRGAGARTAPCRCRDRPGGWLRGDLVILLVVFGAHPRYRQYDPLGIAELSGHDAAKVLIARQGVDQPPFQGSQPPRQQLESMLPHGQSRTVFRLQDVAVPAHADVVNQIQVEGAEFGFGRPGPADLGTDASQAMDNQRQSLDAAGCLLGHHVDFVAAGQQPRGVLVGPFLGPAATRIKKVDHQGDVHRRASLSGRLRPDRAGAARPLGTRAS